MAKSRSLVVQISGDASSLSRAFGRAEKDTQRFSGKVSGVGSSFRVVGAAATAAATGGLAVFGKSMVSAASDAEETANKFRIVFGGATRDATRELDAFSKATGTSRFALREQAAQLQALIRPMGIATGESAKMSVGLTKLATDLASFNNTSVEEAITALQSGLVGEAEPLRRYGVQLSETRVQAYALAKGYAATKDELTAADKAQARYALILADTKLAQGDATETAGSTANQIKRLQSNVKDVAVALGTQMIPTVRGAVGGLNQFATQLKEGRGAGGAFGDAMGALKDVVVGVVNGIRSLVGWFGRHRTATTALLAVVAGLTTAFVAYKVAVIAANVATRVLAVSVGILNVVMRANPIGLVVTALVALGAGLVVVYKRSEKFREVVNAAFRVVRTVVVAAVEAIADVIRKVAGVMAAYARVYARVAGTLARAIVDAFNSLKALPGKVGGVLGDVTSKIRGWGGNFGSAALGLGKSIVTGILGGLGQLGHQLLAKVKDALGFVGKGIKGAGGFIGKQIGKISGDVTADLYGNLQAAQGGAMMPSGGPQGNGRLSGGVTGDTQGLAGPARSGVSMLASKFGGFNINSGFRTFAENQRAGGAKRSDHLTGMGTDLAPAGGWSAAGVAQMDRIAAWARSSPMIRWIGWRGIPNHGPGNHLHLSWAGTGGPRGNGRGDVTPAMGMLGRHPKERVLGLGRGGSVGDVSGLGGNAARIFQFFKSKGFTDGQAAGWIGNLQQESGLNPGAIEAGGKGPGHGLAQWSFGRWTNLQQYAARQRKPWGDLNTQLNFLWSELQGPERAAYNAIRGAKGTQDAAATIGLKYERYGIRGNRSAPADAAYKAFAGGKAGTSRRGGRGGRGGGGGAPAPFKAGRVGGNVVRGRNPGMMGVRDTGAARKRPGDMGDFGDWAGPLGSTGRTEMSLANIDAAEAQAGAPNASTLFQRAFVTRQRLTKVERALSGRLGRPKRLALTQERAGLLSSLREIGTATKDLQNPAAADGAGDGAGDGGDPNQPLIDAIEKAAEDARQIAEEQARQAEELRAATEAHTAAIKETSDALDRQTAFGQSVAATENNVLKRMVADVISGQLGALTTARSFTPGHGVEWAY